MFSLPTERLLLRDFLPTDADAYLSLTRDAKYQRFYSEKDCSEARGRALVESFVAQAAELPRSKYQLAIVLPQTGQLIGTCGLRLKGEGQASICCGLAREFQTGGLAREAMSALVAHGFHVLDVHRLYAETIADNKAAIALCRQAGMRREAHFREHRFFKDRWWDTVIYALLRSEWAQSQQTHRSDSP